MLTLRIIKFNGFLLDHLYPPGRLVSWVKKLLIIFIRVRIWSVVSTRTGSLLTIVLVSGRVFIVGVTASIFALHFTTGCIIGIDLIIIFGSISSAIMWRQSSIILSWIIICLSPYFRWSKPRITVLRLLAVLPSRVIRGTLVWSISWLV
jgi:hypothetical protein